MSKDPRISLTAGCIAGAVECCCTWPMEYIKTQLQTFRKVHGGPPPPFTSIGGGLVYTVRKTGFLSLYNGLAPVLLFSVPKAGIRFGANTYFKNLFRDKVSGKITMLKSFFAGVCAGVCEATFAVTPQETIKTKLINLNMGMTSGVAHIVKHEGLGGLYNGLFSTCLKQAGNQGSRFFFMAQVRQFMTGDAEAKLPKHVTFVGGLGAGLFSVLTTSPFDVVKTRMQSTEAKHYKNTIDCFVQILKHEGPFAFFNGAVARAARVVPGQGIIFVSVDVVYDLIDSRVKK
eukprot:CAMPEP_0118896338 /NCGR_PEP_ID=MMETSP1166-20130328/4253_1 /TAXON_ID=1104430 /ORGANISM="Chrysoreinhardia sp, Strain CCMP3193" /LENGTH=286 /DNA_ID=CAMNT_0006835395 /DNA_START=84 /DNA_END=944 /DNA_ORIENTATION=-